MIGLETWFYNFSQFFYKASTPEALADIPRPYLEYSIWGLFKGAEISSVAGGLVAHPIYRWYLHRQLTPEKTTPNSHKIIRNACRRLQGRFLLAGLFAGPVIATIHSLSIGDEAVVREKCYQIRCDTEPLSMDRFVAVFGFIGWYWKRFQGAVDGINIAIIYSLINAKHVNVRMDPGQLIRWVIPAPRVKIIAPRTSPIFRDRVQPHERYKSAEDAMYTGSRLKKFLAEQEKQKSIESNK